VEGYTRGCQKEHFGGQLMAKRKVFRKSFWQKVLTFLGGLGAAILGVFITDSLRRHSIDEGDNDSGRPLEPDKTRGPNIADTVGQVTEAKRGASEAKRAIERTASDIQRTGTEIDRSAKGIAETSSRLAELIREAEQYGQKPADAN